MDKNETTGAASANQRLDSIKESVKGFVDRGERKVDEIRSRVVDARDQAMKSGNDLLGRVADMIRDHPLKAVGIAFGVGYVGMRLFRRRRTAT